MQQLNGLDRARMLTAGLKKSDNWRRMQRLLCKHADAVNPIHACAVLSRLPTLTQAPTAQLDGGPDERQQLAAFCHQMLSYVEVHVSRLGPRELANVLGAVAKLGIAPRWAWLLAMADAAHAQLPVASGQDCGSISWALARMRYQPAATWQAAFIARCEACMRDGGGGMDAQALANALWALAQWAGRGAPRLPPPFLHTAAAAVAARLPRFTGQGLANVLWAFAQPGLRHHPRSEWMAAYWEAAATAVLDGKMSAAELSTILFAAGKLECGLPRADTLQVLIGFLSARVHELSFSGASCALWGLAVLHHRPDALLPAWFDHTRKAMDLVAAAGTAGTGATAGTAGTMGMEGTAGTAGMAGTTETGLGATWDVGLSPKPTSHAGAPSSAPHSKVDHKSLANALYALQRLDTWSPPASECGGLVPVNWLQSAVSASLSLLPEMDTRALAVTGLCLAKQQAPVSSAWLSAYAAAVRTRLGDMNAAELTNVLCALARFRYVPSKPLLLALMAAVADNTLRFESRELANACLALAHMTSAHVKARAGAPVAPAPCEADEQDEGGEDTDGLTVGVMWTHLHREVRQRWQALPAASMQAKHGIMLRHAILTARQSPTWLERSMGTRNWHMGQGTQASPPPQR